MPLGVEHLNENKVDEMCTIMKNILSYIPKAVHLVLYEEKEAVEEFFQGVLFGGDQLTVCWSQRVKVLKQPGIMMT